MYVTECCYFYFPIGRGFGGPAFQALAEVCHTLGRSICFSATAALSFSVKHRPRRWGGGRPRLCPQRGMAEIPTWPGEMKCLPENVLKPERA